MKNKKEKLEFVFSLVIVTIFLCLCGYFVAYSWRSGSQAGILSKEEFDSKKAFCDPLAKVTKKSDLPAYCYNW